MAELNFEVNLDNKAFIQSINQVQMSMNNLASKMEDSGRQMEDAMNQAKYSVMGLAAEFGMGFSAVGFVKQVAQVRGQFQALESSFRTLLGSEEKANELMAQLTETAAITPFDLQGVAKGAKQLLAYGMEADKVNDKIIELGNIASGMGLSIDYITQLYGTTVSKDYMDTMDLKQFKGQGIAIDEAIAQVMKVEKQEVPKLISQHKVTSDIVESAISAMAGSDGKFAGMMENQSKTILGQISNLEDAIDTMFNEIGKSQEGVISDAIGGVSYIVENYEKFGKVLAGLVATYGTYKTAVMAVSAYNTIEFKAQIGEYEKLKDIVGSTGDAELDLAVKKGYLSQAEAQNIIAIRQEAEAHVQNLQAQAEEAAMAEALATTKLQTAQDEVKTAQELYDIAVASGNQEEIQTATETLNTAMRNEKVAVMERETASQIRVTASEAADTAAQQLNTASKVGATKASAMLAVAQQKLSAIMKATGLSALANPYVLAATAIVGLGYAIYRACTYTTDYENALNSLNESQVASGAEADIEKKKLSDLVDNLEKAEKGTEEYEEAKNNLISTYDKYLPNMKEEIEKGKDLKQIHEEIAKAIQDEADVRAYNENQKEIEDTFKEKSKDYKTTIFKDLQKYFDGDKEKAKQTYDLLLSEMEQGNLRVENSYNRLGLVSETKTIAVGKAAMELRDILKDMTHEYQTGYLTRGFSTEAIVGKLATAQEDYQKLSEDNKTIFGIDKDKTDRVEGINKAMNEEVKATKGGLDNIIKEIVEAEKNLAEAKKGFREGATHESANKQNSKMIEWTMEDVDAYESKLKEAKDKYQKATDVSWDSRNKLLQQIQKSQESLYLFNEQQMKETEKKIREQNDTLEQARIDAMDDGFQKRYQSRMLANRRELQQIIDNGEAEKKEIINQAKDTFEKEQDILEAQAEASGNKKFQRKQFSIRDYMQSDDYKQKAEKVDDYTDILTQQAQDSQRKAEAEAEKKDLDERQAYYEKYLSIEKDFVEREKELKMQLAQGKITEESYSTMLSVAENNKNEALSASGYDEESLKSSAKDIVDVVNVLMFGSVENLLQTTKDTLDKIAEAKDEGNQELIAQLKAQLSALQEELKEKEKEGKLDKNPTKFIDAWNKYGTAIRGVTGRVNGLTKAISANGDETLETISEVSESVFDIFDSLSQMQEISQNAIEVTGEMVNVSVDGMEATAEAGEKTMESVEKASVILAIIGAAYQIIMKLSELIDDADAQYKRAAEKQAEINRLTLSVQEYQQEVAKAKRMENAWFSQTGLDSLSENWHDAQDAMKNYYSKAYEQQATYQNESGGGWLKKFNEVVTYPLTAVTKLSEKIPVIGEAVEKLHDPLQTIDVTQGWEAGLNDYQKSYKNAMENLRIETRAATKGALGTGIGAKSQKTEDLREWVKKNFKDDLFDDSDNLNTTLAQRVLDEKGDKLVGETKETLEQLIKYQTELDEAMSEMKDYVSTMYSPIVDNMTSALFDWLDTGKDVMDSFQNYASDTFRNVAQEMVQQMIQDNVLKGYQDNMMDVYKEYTSGKYGEVGTESALKTLSQKSADLSKQVMTNFEEQADGLKAFTQSMADVYNNIGVDITGKSEEQSATYGGYETLSEETGTELSGRFSAMYIVQSEQLALMQSISMLVQSATDAMLSQGGVMEDMRNLQLIANDHLNSIATATRQMYASWDERIENIEKYTRNL